MSDLTSTSVRPVSRAAGAAAPLATLRTWWAAWRRRRAQRLTLMMLMRMDPARLDDMGIDIAEITDALRNPPRR